MKKNENMEKINFIRKIAVFLSIILVLLTTSCIYGTNNFLYKGNKVDTRVNSIKEVNDFVPELASASKYRVLVLADVHIGGNTPVTNHEVLFDWLAKLRVQDPENYPKFCLILGDNVDHGYESEFIDYVNFTKKIEALGIPVMNILGNHDLYNSGWDFYEKMCYPYCSAFHFTTKNFSWYAVDTGTGDIGIKQYNILKRAFEKDKKPKIVLSHYPFANSKWFGIFCLHDPTERNLVLDLFAKNGVKAALCGHLHQTQAADLQQFKEYGLPSFRYTKNGWNIFEIDEDNLTVTKLELNYPEY